MLLKRPLKCGSLKWNRISPQNKAERKGKKKSSLPRSSGSKPQSLVTLLLPFFAMLGRHVRQWQTDEEMKGGEKHCHLKLCGENESFPTLSIHRMRLTSQTQ